MRTLFYTNSIREVRALKNNELERNNNMNNLQTLPSNGIQNQIDNFTVSDVKKYITPNATDKEFFFFMQMVKERNLNPFLNEVYFVKYNSRNGESKGSIIVGKDAILKRAQKKATFGGFKAGWFDEHGHKTEVPLGGKVPAGAWCEVYDSEGRMVVYNAISFQEYTTNQNLWLSKPYTMIRKVAIVQALREFAPEETAGMYEKEEMEREMINITPPEQQQAVKPPQPKPNYKKLLAGLFVQHGLAESEMTTVIQKITNQKRITEEKAQELYEQFKANPEEIYSVLKPTEEQQKSVLDAVVDAAKGNGKTTATDLAATTPFLEKEAQPEPQSEKEKEKVVNIRLSSYIKDKNILEESMRKAARSYFKNENLELEDITPSQTQTLLASLAYHPELLK